MKAKVYVVSAAIAALVILSAYIIVFHSYGPSGAAVAAVCSLLIFLGLLCLHYLLINSSWNDVNRAVICVLVTIPVIYFLTRAESNFENKSLQLHAINDTEAITYTYVNKGKSGVVYHAVYQYTYSGQTYTHTLGNYHNVYKMGDTVKIVYSAEHPNIAKVVEYRSK